MLGASMSWSTGSFFSSRLSLPADTFVATVYEMLGGGAVLVVAALLLGEGSELTDGVSAASLAAWVYLAVFGSLIAFTAYAWLLRNAPISQVVTHQYVNPLVAIALGSIVLGETLDALTVVGALIVIGAVFMTVRSEARARPPVTVAAEPSPAAPVRAK